MRNLIKLISLYNYSITFYLLFLISSYLLITENFVLQTKFFNSSNYISGSVFSAKSAVSEYFLLKKKNTVLESENKKLKEELINLRSVNNFVDNNQYNFIDAEIINNSTRKKNNYITINKGSKDGVKEGMGVISNLGIVGKVKYVSNNFATIISLLNSSYFVSSLIKKTNTLSSINWDGNDPKILDLLYVPKHIDIQKGDSVITSSFDTIFPKGILIGEIASINKDINSNFYDIDIISSQNFYNLSKVYLVDNILYQEKKTLESATDEK
tara:strand:- start:837 stop:1643 length:807 start_codon:yes stop_codon:yes gene_type:complete